MFQNPFNMTLISHLSLSFYIPLTYRNVIIALLNDTNSALTVSGLTLTLCIGMSIIIYDRASFNSTYSSTVNAGTIHGALVLAGVDCRRSECMAQTDCFLPFYISWLPLIIFDITLIYPVLLKKWKIRNLWICMQAATCGISIATSAKLISLSLIPLVYLTLNPGVSYADSTSFYCHCLLWIAVVVLGKWVLLLFWLRYFTLTT